MKHDILSYQERPEAKRDKRYDRSDPPSDRVRVTQQETNYATYYAASDAA